jgi:hypothetical protein
VTAVRADLSGVDPLELNLATGEVQKPELREAYRA